MPARQAQPADFSQRSFGSDTQGQFHNFSVSAGNNRQFTGETGSRRTASRTKQPTGSGICRDHVGFRGILSALCGIFRPVLSSPVATLVSRWPAYQAVFEHNLVSRTAARCTRSASLATCGHHQLQGTDEQRLAPANIPSGLSALRPNLGRSGWFAATPKPAIRSSSPRQHSERPTLGQFRHLDQGRRTTALGKSCRTGVCSCDVAEAARIIQAISISNFANRPWAEPMTLP